MLSGSMGKWSIRSVFSAVDLNISNHHANIHQLDLLLLAVNLPLNEQSKYKQTGLSGMTHCLLKSMTTVTSVSLTLPMILFHISGAHITETLLLGRNAQHIFTSDHLVARSALSPFLF